MAIPWEQSPSPATPITFSWYLARTAGRWSRRARHSVSATRKCAECSPCPTGMYRTPSPKRKATAESLWISASNCEEDPDQGPAQVQCWLGSVSALRVSCFRIASGLDDGSQDRKRPPSVHPRDLNRGRAPARCRRRDLLPAFRPCQLAAAAELGTPARHRQKPGPTQRARSAIARGLSGLAAGGCGEAGRCGDTDQEPPRAAAFLAGAGCELHGTYLDCRGSGGFGVAGSPRDAGGAPSPSACQPQDPRRIRITHPQPGTTPLFTRQLVAGADRNPRPFCSACSSHRTQALGPEF